MGQQVGHFSNNPNRHSDRFLVGIRQTSCNPADVNDKALQNSQPQINADDFFPKLQGGVEES